MHFDKKPLSIPDQVERLLERGLVCDRPERLKHYLTHVGYYRLSAYWLPFEIAAPESNGSRNHKFRPDTTFDQVLALYIFDRKLRLLVIEAIERIETAVRGHWANALSMRHGSHAHMKPELFKCPWQHSVDLAKISADLKNSSETFIVHYRRRYSDPFLPPIWAVVETMSLGALSRWFQSTRDTESKKEVAKCMGMPTIEILEQVLHALTPIRNICAHHGRLWNRRFTLQLPHIKKFRDQIMTESIESANGTRQIQPRREIYNYLVIMLHLMNAINPGSSWRNRLETHLQQATPDQHQAMGFPTGWADLPLWKVAV
jgi:abortive infection bacteriophage resistance protein